MYFGSVKFFRHIIVACVVALLVIATATSVFSGIKSMHYEQLYRQASADLQDLKDSQAQAEDNFSDQNTTVDELSLTPTAFSDSPTHELAYQDLYPDLVTPPVFEAEVKPNTIYLTFDDGPSNLTPQILDILEKHNVKATFFIVGNQLNDSGAATLRRIVAQGHTVGVHSDSHKYHEIYASVDNYLADFYATSKKIEAITGTKPSIFRFPGGSINGYNQRIYQQLIAEMARRGFVYYDWNVSAEDASATATSATSKSNILPNIKKNTRSIVLMHDTKSGTAAALDSIITALQAQGYSFDCLTPAVKPVIFSYRT